MFSKLRTIETPQGLLAVFRADGIRIALVAGVAATAVWLAVSAVPTVHRAEWTVRVTGREANPAVVSDLVKTLQSDKMLAAAAGRLAQTGHSDRQPGGVPANVWAQLGLSVTAERRPSDADLAAAMRRRLSVAAPLNTQRLELAAETADPKLSAALLVAWIEAWRAEARQAAHAAATAQLAVEERRLAGLAISIRDVAAKIDTATRARPSTDDLARLAQQAAEAEAAAKTAAQRATEAREALARGDVPDLTELRTAPALQALWQQRARVEQQIAELQVSLKPNHPRMRQLAGEKAAIDRQILEDANKMITALGPSAEAARRVAAAARREVEEATAAADGKRLSELEQSLSALRADAKTGEQSMTTLKAEIAAGSLPMPLALSTPGQPSVTLRAPARTRWAFLAGSIAAVAALLWALRRQRSAAPVAAALRHPRTSSPLALNIPDAAARVGIAAMERKGFRTVVATETPATTATLEATALARVLASDGRQVLLIDVTADALTRSASPLRGLADVLADGRFDDAIVELPRSDVHFMAWNGHRTGTQTANADGLNATFDALDDVYDHIVLAGEHTDLARVFEAIEGRVDLAFVTDGTPAGDGETVRLLGFDVADLVVLPLQSAAQPAAVPSNGHGPRQTGSLVGGWLSRFRTAA